MNAILHILRKDFRHHWREAALYVFACAAWAWQTAYPSSLQFFRERELFPILLFGTWFLITIRVVQGESLLGDREFWMTRPYRWPQLMAAKGLFLVLCLNGPLLLAEIFLLHHAGLPLTASTFAGLLLLQLEFAVFLTFPAAVLATITESLVQWVLVILGLLLLALVLSWLPWNKLPATLAGQENIASYLGAAIVIPALAFALFWQYARRRVWQSRLAVLLVVFAVPCCLLIAHTAALHSLAYAARADDQLPVRFAMKDNAGANTYFRGMASGESALISLPLAATFADSDTILSSDGFRITLTGDKNWHWQSPWINRAIQLSPDEPRTTVDFNMPDELLGSLSQVHPKATVELAFTLYHLDPAERVPTVSYAFQLPGINCHWPSGVRELYFRNASECAAPLRLPGILIARIDSADVTCPPEPGEHPLPAGLSATYTRFGSDGFLVDFDPNPVRDPNLNFPDWVPPLPSTRNPKDVRHVSFCRGTPVTIRTGHPTGQYQSWFDLGPLGQPHHATIQYDPYRVLPDNETPAPQP